MELVGVWVLVGYALTLLKMASDPPPPMCAPPRSPRDQPVDPDRRVIPGDADLAATLVRAGEVSTDSPDPERPPGG